MIRTLLLILLTFTYIQAAPNAKKIGIVLINNNVLEYKDSLKDELKTLMQTQTKYYSDLGDIELTIDRHNTLKQKYDREGTEALVEYAHKHSLSSLAFVSYKKSSRYLSIFVVATQDDINERKSKSVAFSKNSESALAKTLFATVLMLNYELGVISAKDIY